MSFEVVALFTSITTNVAITAAKLLRLDQDDNLRERTQLSPRDITSLLEFSLDATEFSFKGRFYKQIHGTAMGSPVSVVVANLCMEVLETKAVSTFLNILDMFSCIKSVKEIHCRYLKTKNR